MKHLGIFMHVLFDDRMRLQIFILIYVSDGYKHKC